MKPFNNWKLYNSIYITGCKFVYNCNHRAVFFLLFSGRGGIIKLHRATEKKRETNIYFILVKIFPFNNKLMRRKLT